MDRVDQQKIVGTWRLVSSKKILPDGTVVDVFGNHPIGYFIFTEDHIMSVQIMRHERKNFHGEALLDDYLAYTGSYAVDEHKKIITLQVETSLSANYLGKEIKRAYHCDNNLLELKVLESELDYRIVWERL